MVTNKVKSMDWMAGVFYPLAVVLMEAFWVSPWLNWLGRWPLFRESRPVLSLGSVILVLALALLITRFAIRLKSRLWSIQALVIGSGLLVMLFVLGYEYAGGYTFLSASWFAHTFTVLGETATNTGTIVAAIPVMIYLWWRGINLGQSTSYFRDIYRTFLLGLVALIALIIIWQITSTSPTIGKPGAGLGANVIAFFFFGLIAIAISHLYMMRSTMPKEEAALTSVWRWLPIMLGVIGGLVLIGFLIASALSPQFFTAFGHGAIVFLKFLGKILGYIAIPIVYLAEGMMWLFKWFISLLRGSNNSGESSGNVTSPFPQNTVSTGLPHGLTEAIKWVVIVGVVALIIWLLARSISRFRARHRDEFDELRESLFSWKNLRDDLRLMFGALGNRFRRKAPAPVAHAFDENAEGRMDIREIYRHLQWEAGKSGVPRRRHETPDEYAKRLRRSVPEAGTPLGDITDMYKSVRYGEVKAPESHVDNANSLWQTLKSFLSKIRGG